MRAPWLGGRKGAGRRRLIGNGRLVTADQLIEDGIVIIEGDQIVYAGPVAGVPAGAAAGAAELDAGGGYICPGFIDGHVHGGGGGDVMDAAPEALERMARAHAAHGTTGFVGTTMSAPH
ncbi:MAG: amidohydrolase family protein, partial [Limnochordales bacterium]